MVLYLRALQQAKAANMTNNYPSFIPFWGQRIMTDAAQFADVGPFVLVPGSCTPAHFKLGQHSTSFYHVDDEFQVRKGRIV